MFEPNNGFSISLREQIETILGEESEKHRDVRQLFLDADVNKDGKLDYLEFSGVFYRFGYVDDGSLHKLMRRFDFDDSGFIDYQEFMRYFAPQLYSSEQHGEMDRRSTILAVTDGLENRGIYKRQQSVGRKPRGLVEGLAGAQKEEDVIHRKSTATAKEVENQNLEDLENLETRMVSRIEGLMMDMFSGLMSHRDVESTATSSPGRPRETKRPRGATSSEVRYSRSHFGSISKAQPSFGERFETRALGDELVPSALKELTNQRSDDTSTSDCDEGDRTTGPTQRELAPGRLLSAVTESSGRTTELPRLGEPRSAPTTPQDTLRDSNSNAETYIKTIDSDHYSCYESVTHKDLEGLEERLMGRISKEVHSSSHMPTCCCEIYSP